MPLKLSLIAGLLCLLTAAPAWAADSLAGAFHDAFEDGLAPLRKAGFKPGDLLVAERLPNGRFVAEFEVISKTHTARVPVVAEFTGKWNVTWTPDKAYQTALSNMVSSGQLPVVEHADRWVQASRLPAMPVIVTASRIITPFGALDAEAPAAGDLSPIKPLTEHVQMWLNQTLQQDPGPAGVDVLIDTNLTWQALTKVVLTVAMQGLYQVNLVCTNDRGEIGALSVAAPVASAQAPNTAPPLVVGMYELDDIVGFRIGLKGEIYKGEAPCSVDMSICATSPGMFRTMVSELIANELFKDVKQVKYTMFAATGDVTVGKALGYLDQVVPALKLSPNATFIGYIQK